MQWNFDWNIIILIVVQIKVKSRLSLIIWICNKENELQSFIF